MAAATTPDPISDAAWRTSALRLCLSLGCPAGGAVKDEIAKLSAVAVDLGAFVLEGLDDEEKRRRMYVAELAFNRWPLIPPDEFMALVRMLVCGVVEDVPPGGFKPGDFGAAS
jgi:hypothetical protein